MRPRAWSEKGFLGPKERLMTVIRKDEATLQRLGITHAQIADKIEELIKIGEEETLARWRARDRTSWRIDRSPITVGQFSIIILGPYLGHQECPWSFYDPSTKPPRRKPCTVGSGPMYGDLDFVITNNRTGETLTGPGLIVHLIRDHHFFEGKQSPYRVDPEKAAGVLELIKD